MCNVTAHVMTDILFSFSFQLSVVSSLTRRIKYSSQDISILKYHFQPHCTFHPVKCNYLSNLQEIGKCQVACRGQYRKNWPLGWTWAGLVWNGQMRSLMTYSELQSVRQHPTDCNQIPMSKIGLGQFLVDIWTGSWARRYITAEERLRPWEERTRPPRSQLMHKFCYAPKRRFIVMQPTCSPDFCRLFIFFPDS